MTERFEALKSLHTSLVDSKNGYDEALEDAEGQGLTPLFRTMIAIHERDAEEVAGLLHAHGQEADEGGSFMSTVHRTIMGIRSLFGGLDESVLPGLIDGEKRVLGYYDDAIREAGPSASDHGTLVGQRTALAGKIGEMEAAVAK